MEEETKAEQTVLLVFTGQQPEQTHVRAAVVPADTAAALTLTATSAPSVEPAH